MKTDWQWIIALGLLAVAIAYLIRPFFKKKKKAEGCDKCN